MPADRIPTQVQFLSLPFQMVKVEFDHEYDYGGVFFSYQGAAYAVYDAAKDALTMDERSALASKPSTTWEDRLRDLREALSDTDWEFEFEVIVIDS